MPARPKKRKLPASSPRAWAPLASLPLASRLDTADRLHSAAIHLLRRVRREDAGAGIPAPQLSALSVIVFRAGLTLGELAHAEQVRPPTITRIVADLERAGLAVRSPRESDRRVIVVRATTK